MRVLSVGNMYPPHHLGGYEVVWHSADRYLRSQGHQVRVLTSDFRTSEPGGEDPDVHRELRWYWRDHRFPRLGLLRRLALERHNARTFDRHVAELRPHVVSWWAMGGMSLSLIERARRRGLPAVGFVHDDWMLYGPVVDGWQRAVRTLGGTRRIADRLTGIPSAVDLPGAAAWIFNSEMTRRHALEAYGELDRAAVAHPGIDPTLLRPAPARPWRGRLLCLGRLDRRKGIHIAITALRHLPATTLSVIGSGDASYRGELDRLASEAQLGERVAFGRVSREELRAAYAGADALLFPSLWEEPWGLVPLEAMAVGIPVIATGTGGSSEYLRDGENCLLYSPPDDPRALAAAVKRLSEDAQLRASLRAAGFETASHFTEAEFNRAVESALARAARA